MLKYMYLMLFAMLAHTVFGQASASDIQSTCSELVQKYSTKYTLEDALCLSPDFDFSRENILADQKFVVLLGAEDIPITPEILQKHFSGKTFTLLIDGICISHCSRLLMPMGKFVTFTDGSFAALTDNSVIPRSQDQAEKLGIADRKPTGGTFSGDVVRKAFGSYMRDHKANYLRDVDLIGESMSEITHLQWQAQVKQAARYIEGAECRRVKALSVIMTREYMRSNGMLLRGPYKMPRRDDLVERLSELVGPNWVFYTYDMRPLNKCPF